MLIQIELLRYVSDTKQSLVAAIRDSESSELDRLNLDR